MLNNMSFFLDKGMIWMFRNCRTKFFFYVSSLFCKKKKKRSENRRFFVRIEILKTKQCFRRLFSITRSKSVEFPFKTNRLNPQYLLVSSFHAQLSRFCPCQIHYRENNKNLQFTSINTNSLGLSSSPPPPNLIVSNYLPKCYPVTFQ